MDVRELPGAFSRGLDEFRNQLCSIDAGYARASDATVTGRLILAWLLERWRGWNWRQTMGNIRYSENGKPFFEAPGVYFSISHSGGRIAVVVAEEPIGLDIQVMSEMKLGYAEHFLHPAEFSRFEALGCFAEGRQFEGGQDPEAQLDFLTRCWSRKEAALKCRGQGLLKRRLTEMDLGTPMFEDMQLATGRLAEGLVCSIAFITRTDKTD
jgi:phosphopantetheinyl transferase